MFSSSVVPGRSDQKTCCRDPNYKGSPDLVALADAVSDGIRGDQVGYGAEQRVYPSQQRHGTSDRKVTEIARTPESAKEKNGDKGSDDR